MHPIHLWPGSNGSDWPAPWLVPWPEAWDPNSDVAPYDGLNRWGAMKSYQQN
jgi:hypothetical protein